MHERRRRSRVVYFVNHRPEWPLPSVGLPHFSGRYPRGEEYRVIMGDANRGRISTENWSKAYCLSWFQVRVSLEGLRRRD